MSDATQKVPQTDNIARPARRPILVAVGATGGVPALRMARALAARDASEVAIVSVTEPPPAFTFESRRVLLTPWTIEQQLDDRRATVLERLHLLGWTHDRHGQPTITTRYGDAAYEIVDVARECNAKLIVMGIGPHSHSRRFLGTGTTWATSRKAPCPVLAVADDANGPPHSAVAAIDFSAESIHAAHDALGILADGAVVHLVHAWSRVETVTPLDALDVMNAEYAKALPGRFDRVRSVLGRGRSLSYNSIAVEEKPAEAVLKVAHDSHAELVIAGTHGYGTLDRLLLGSTSSALLRGAECSVLLVPPPPVVERTRLTRHMTGTSTVRAPHEWDAELRAFVGRNRDRRTALEIDNYVIGAQVQECGYSLVGASYDPHDEHIALMFGGGEHGSAHLTRSLGGVRSVAVLSDLRDEDRALCIEADDGGALLTFLDSSGAARSTAMS